MFGIFITMIKYPIKGFNRVQRSQSLESITEIFDRCWIPFRFRDEVLEILTERDIMRIRDFVGDRRDI